jgi:hypothetical protein
VYEPSYSRAALEKDNNLGHIIFGGEVKWESLGGSVWENCPLEKYYSDRGMLLHHPHFTMH